MSQLLDGGMKPAPVAGGRAVMLFFVFIAGYFLLGLAGLQLQSAQTGITPLWPASGFAFAMVYRYGLGQLLAIPPAMTGLGLVIGVPMEIAAVSALGSMLEAGVPAYVLRRAGLDPRLHHVRDTLLFVAIGPVLGPVLSATTGVVAFVTMGDSSLDPVRLWLLWWLGNSVGLLLAGGFGLVAMARGSLRVRPQDVAELVAASAAVVVITAAGMVQIGTVTSSLILYLLIPVFVLVAQRGDQYRVMLLGVLVMVVMLLSAGWLPPESVIQHDLGILYLDVSLLWVVTFTGMVISGARQEVHARERVSWLANHDPLTRLLNRHAFMDRLEVVLAKIPETGTGFVLMYLDLDRFKDLNDAEGHHAGDQVLRDTGEMLGRELRSKDAVARLGGDEFAAIIEDCELLDACAIAENIRGVIERYEYRGKLGVHRVEVCIGVVQLDAGYRTPEDALHAADSACYDAKRSGRNRVCIYSDTATG